MYNRMDAYAAHDLCMYKAVCTCWRMHNWAHARAYVSTCSTRYTTHTQYINTLTHIDKYGKFLSEAHLFEEGCVVFQKKKKRLRPPVKP